MFADAADRMLRDLRLDVVHDTGLGTHFDIFQSHGGSFSAWVSRRLAMHPRWLQGAKRAFDSLLPRHREFTSHWQRQCGFAKSADKTIVALSKAVADDLVRLDGMRAEQVSVVYNGVDCQRFSPDRRAEHRKVAREQIKVGEGTQLLLLAAHNLRLKGAAELLQAAGRLVQSGRNLHVAVAGGKRLDRWRRTAARAGLAGRATFLGTIADMTPYYAAADAYVHPTYYDPCSLVLLEAAASGLPIVTTRRFNGAAELFKEGEEILTVGEPAEIDGLSDRIDALFDERLRRQIGTAARKVALQHTMDRNVAEILRLYDGRGHRRVAA
jgi:UDP-glucose:(heptosyl)LPS alpha-1,3-glucosyltransferase